MNKKLKLLIIFFILSFLLFSYYLFIHRDTESVVKYDTKEDTIDNLLSKSLTDGDTHILEDFCVNDIVNIIVFYNDFYECVFFAKILNVNNKYIIEERSSYIGIGEDYSFITFNVNEGENISEGENVDVKIYFWKDIKNDLISNDEIFKLNKDKIRKYDNDIYLLLLKSYNR